MKYYILLFLSFQVFSTDGQTTKDLSNAATAFLETLEEAQMTAMHYAFEDTARTNWTNLPIGLASRPGLRYGDLSEKSKIQFHQLLITLLSSQGYLKATSIMQLDDVLNKVYQTAFERELIPENTLKEIQDLQWDYGNYYVSMWNYPHPSEPWGLKFEGHHISINLTVTGQEYAVTPLFFGTDPAEVPITKYAGLRVLSKEEDYGIRLINALSDKQREVATISNNVPGDIITNPASPQYLTEYAGIRGGQLSDVQKEMLRLLIYEYMQNFEQEKAHAAMHFIEGAAIDQVYFGWIGSYARKKPHYYVIQGPDFMIEYDNVGFQNDGNHIHTIYREKGRNFGENLLKAHYLEHKH
jgi:hypothetical protein